MVASTGLNDPRRRPLVDLSNGDYSDIKNHLRILCSPPPPSAPPTAPLSPPNRYIKGQVQHNEHIHQCLQQYLLQQNQKKQIFTPYKLCPSKSAAAIKVFFYLTFIIIFYQ